MLYLLVWCAIATKAGKEKFFGLSALAIQDEGGSMIKLNNEVRK